jgi:hypothetical protein
MRGYIFTNRERKLLSMFMEDGIKLEGYATLKGRMFDNLEQILKDAILAGRYIAQVEDEVPFWVLEVVQDAKNWVLEYMKNQDEGGLVEELLSDESRTMFLNRLLIKAFENQRDPVVISSAEPGNEILYANDAYIDRKINQNAETGRNLKESEIIGASHWDVLLSDRNLTMLHKRLEKMDVVEETVYVPTGDWLVVRAFNIRLGGKKVAYGIILKNITPLKLLEDQMKDLVEKLEKEHRKLGKGLGASKSSGRSGSAIIT